MPWGSSRVWLGLFFFLAGCAPPTPAQAAARADARYATGGFSWLAAHDPSALVAWGVAAAELRPVAPNARVEAARDAAPPGGPCLQAAAAHAALFVLVPHGPGEARRRELALDCGPALYRDARVLVIAPR